MDTTRIDPPGSAGAVLRDARLRSGLSLRALARRAGTSHATIRAYETGSKVPGFDTLCRLLDACGYDLDIRLSKRIRERDGVDRGDELLDVLRLADAFPVRRPGSRIERPAFPG